MNEFDQLLIQQAFRSVLNMRATRPDKWKAIDGDKRAGSE